MQKCLSIATIGIRVFKSITDGNWRKAEDLYLSICDKDHITHWQEQLSISIDS